ncbi:hypothetical protein LXA43DRAFT_1019819 [Ganoderma leucocontextum]|nr:hypothetical protein LXA43DRAFT_1019819 [Ganoderma leucocontextum]
MRPPHATAHPVQLESNTLYISTVPLLSNVFHWALVHINPDGIATRHHWAATTMDPQGPEAYVEQELPHGPMSKVDKDHILAYFKISDYSPMDVTELREICSAVFPSSYPTAQENRRADITCRTWITHILSRLIPAERAQEIEELVKKHSTTYSGTFASDFLFQRQYNVQVFTL